MTIVLGCLVCVDVIRSLEYRNLFCTYTRKTLLETRLQAETVDHNEICIVEPFDVLRRRFIQMRIDTVGNQNDDVCIGTDDLLGH